MIVLKFGGTSVADAPAIDRAASITRSRLPRRPIVVVSALAGVTNTLLRAAHDATLGDRAAVKEALSSVRERHMAVVEELAGRDPTASDTGREVERTYTALVGFTEALAVLGHATPRSLDTMAAYGEQLSALLAVAAFRGRGLPAVLVDARLIVVTDDHFTQATPIPHAIANAAARVLSPLVEGGQIPVLGGYVGATTDGATTTLGRGGSDFSASLIGAALDAEAIEIWTDVDGMLTADPRIEPCARPIDHIRFDEAAELAAFGARVLHPATIAPAVRKGIPVCILNSFRPEVAGTRITAGAPMHPVRAIAGRDNVTVIKVRTSEMLMAHGFLRTLFEVFERRETSVDVVATSEVTVSVTVDDPAPIDAITADLAPLGEVTVERERAVVAVVGAGLGGDSTTMARALGALAGIRVHMVAVGATEINLTLVVGAEHFRPAIRRLHAAFFADLPAGTAVLPSFEVLNR